MFSVGRERVQACNFIKKETLVQVFSCEYYEIRKNTFSYRTSPVAASDISEEPELVFFRAFSFFCCGNKGCS